MAATTTPAVSYQSVTIFPNQTVYVPKNATIIGINSSGDIEIDSSCLDLTAPPFACYTMSWSVSADRTPSVALEHQATAIAAMTILGSTYPITGLQADPEAGTNTIFNTFLATYGLSNIVSVPVFARPDQIGDRYPVELYFKTTSEIAATMELKLTGPDFNNGLWVKAVSADSGCVDNPS